MRDIRDVGSRQIFWEMSCIRELEWEIQNYAHVSKVMVTISHVGGSFNIFKYAPGMSEESALIIVSHISMDNIENHEREINYAVAQNYLKREKKTISRTTKYFLQSSNRIGYVFPIKYDILINLRAKLFRGSIKYIFIFYVIPPHRYDTYIVNSMAAGVLATKGARTSAAMILT